MAKAHREWLAAVSQDKQMDCDYARGRKRQRWLVIGYYGGLNTGDDIMLNVFCEFFARVADADFVVLTKRGRAISLRSQKSLANLKVAPAGFWSYLGELLASDGVLQVGGTLIHDELAGKRGKRQTLNLLRLSGALLLARGLGRRVVLLAVGYGPVRRWWSKLLGAIAVRASSQIVVRDRATLQRVGRHARGKVHLGFDLAVLTPRVDAGRVECPSPGGEEFSVAIAPVCLGDMLTPVGRGDDSFWRHVVNATAVAGRKMGIDIRVALIVMWAGSEQADDRLICDRMAKWFRDVGIRSVQIQDYTEEMATVMQRFEEPNVVIAARYHAAMLGYLREKPLLLVPYQQKVVDLAYEIKLPGHALLPPNTAYSQVQDAVTRLLERPEEFRAGFPIRKAQAMARLGLDVLNVAEQAATAAHR